MNQHRFPLSTFLLLLGAAPIWIFHKIQGPNTFIGLIVSFLMLHLLLEARSNAAGWTLFLSAVITLAGFSLQDVLFG